MLFSSDQIRSLRRVRRTLPRSLELGDESVGRIDVNFLTYDTPVARFIPPTTAMVAEKIQWGEVRRKRCFGH